MDDNDTLKVNLPRFVVDDAATVCPACLGTGVVVEREEGVDRARPCSCGAAAEKARRLAAVGVPARYRKCTLANFFETEASEAARAALGAAKDFTANYPAVDGGLLFMGPCGVGKTHLAVGLMQELAETKNARCRFCDFADLLAEVRRCYAGGSFDEYALLAPLVEADVLLIDDLGSMKIRDWTLDILSYVVNQRYVSQRVVVATTNFLDRPADGGAPGSVFVTPTMDYATGFAGAEETLEDRIGPRLRSRLQEMCKTVRVTGDDFRKKVRQVEILRYL